MTPKERVAALIKEGGAITVLFPNDPDDAALEYTLAGVHWLTSPQRFRWCAIFPEHQSHFHETEYTEARLMAKGRDVGFFNAAGQMVAYVCPVEESGINTDEAREALAEWRALLGKYDNAAEFARFLEEA